MDMRPVPNIDLPEMWPLVRQFVSDAARFSGGRFTEKTIADNILHGMMQLWVIEDNGNVVIALITQIRDYPTGLKTCDMVALGGHKNQEWVDLAVSTMSKWAKDLGCSNLEVIGRPGWEKLLKNWGRVSVMLDLPLGERHE